MKQKFLQFNNWFDTKFGWFFTNGRKAAYKSYLEENDDVFHTMEVVSIALEKAKEQNVEIEVVTWALKFMKENPKLTVSEAITMAYLEWDK